GVGECNVSLQRSPCPCTKSCPRTSDWIRRRRAALRPGKPFLSRVAFVSGNSTGTARPGRGRGYESRIRKSRSDGHGRGDHDFHIWMQQWAHSCRRPGLFCDGTRWLVFQTSCDDESESRSRGGPGTAG